MSCTSRRLKGCLVDSHRHGARAINCDEQKLYHTRHRKVHAKMCGSGVNQAACYLLWLPEWWRGEPKAWTKQPITYPTKPKLQFIVCVYGENVAISRGSLFVDTPLIFPVLNMTPLICLAGLGLGPSFLPKALFVSNVSERTAAMTASEYYHTLHIFHFSFQVFINLFLLFLNISI